MLYIIILLFNIGYSDTYSGYLQEVQMSFCMDECAQYFIEPEDGPGLGSSVNIIFNDNFSNKTFFFNNIFYFVELFLI